MQERVWTVIRLPDQRWSVVRDDRSTEAYASREAATEAAIAAARKAVAGLHPASVLLEDASGMREIFPRRRPKRSELPKPKPRGEGQGYELVYFADKFRIPMSAARRILERVGPDREKLNAAARAYKARRLESL